MPGYDDPRYLQQVITKLQADVKKLQRDTLPLLSYQRGPTPGWLAAGQVGPGTSMKAAMHLNMDGNQVGVAPRQTVTDANGIVRFEIGNLAANGVSPAHYGWRVNDASGNPVADTFGPIAQKTGQIIAHGSGSGTFTNTTPSAVGTQSVVVGSNPPNRAVNLLALFFFVGKVSAGTGDGTVLFDPGGAGSPTGSALQGQPTGNTTGAAYEWLTGVAPATYTMQLKVGVSSAGTTYIAQALDFIVIQLGS
jgi:hypothetical protein